MDMDWRALNDAMHDCFGFATEKKSYATSQELKDLAKFVENWAQGKHEADEAVNWIEKFLGLGIDQKEDHSVDVDDEEKEEEDSDGDNHEAEEGDEVGNEECLVENPVSEAPKLVEKQSCIPTNVSAFLL
jgi:hypothetical protein